MSEAKHTPGKWEVDLETGEITAANGQVALGRLYCEDDFPCIDPDDFGEGVQEFQEEFKANAALIEAAPDLLATFLNVIEQQILGHRQNPDFAFTAEYRKGFINGLIEARLSLMQKGNYHDSI